MNFTRSNDTIKKPGFCICRRVRLEFNQNHCEYYTEIDAVYLHGLDSKEEYNHGDETEDSVDKLNKIFARQIRVKSIQDETANFKQDSWNILMLPVRSYADSRARNKVYKNWNKLSAWNLTTIMNI